MDRGLQSAENILNNLRRSRLHNETLLEIKNLLELVQKHGCESKVHQHRIVEELVHLLTGDTDSLEAAVVENSVGCVIWITNLQVQQKLVLLSELQINQVIKWLGEKLKANEENMELASSVCIALDGLLTTHPSYESKSSVSICRDIVKYLSWSSTINVIVHVMRCLENVFISVNPEHPNEDMLDLSGVIGNKLLQLFYCDKIPIVDSIVIPIFLIHSLQLANHVASTNEEFCLNNISELLGFAKSQFHFGVGNAAASIVSPQKVYISQQALHNSTDEFELNTNLEKSRIVGGKTPKTRKPRINARSGDRNSVNMNTETKNILLTFDCKTSDSEVSEQENGANHVLYERNRMAKIRLASIAIVGTLVRMLDRKLIYGYWHGLFPSGTGDTVDNLLYIGRHDPNMRCRCAALQVCAQVLYGSNEYLHQAETDEKRCPTTFIPFSVSLGRTVLCIYKELVTILSTESSLAVLTQALKCLAVLVQATPFQKLQKGFVHSFVKHVRPLIYHRDAAIQVSALMVMEFLLSSSEAKADIAEAVGAPEVIPSRLMSNINPHGDEELDIIENEEYLESDSDDEITSMTQTNSQNNKTEDSAKANCSWLLLRVLDNLGDSNKTAATSVRIESMQVLIAITPHFFMLQSHILEIGVVLRHTLENPLPDVRIHAARCIDSCAYQIGRFIGETAQSSSEVTKKCSQFWTYIMPIIFNHIDRSKGEVATIRITLCDALSNIGVIIFENCTHSSQMGLLSFLSGVSSDFTDDIVVRAAAVRALAVYAMYPSLRADFVFLENTADLTLRLVNDSNLLVRVKSFWSLGNISDALLMEKDNYERISDELLFRIISASVMACSDNDKVRCNAVRGLGNLLRLLTEKNFTSEQANRNWRQLFEKAICKLTDCLRSSGNAKVKWNTCYAISNILRNPTIFDFTDLNWQKTLFPAVCNVIVNHSNFKVRINASAAILSIANRKHFGIYFELFWCSVLEAIEQSYNLDNYHEYNHRDNLQDQLCLALAHIIITSSRDDWPMLRKRMSPRVETIQNTWRRVLLRMVPEKAAPLLSCPVLILERSKCEEVLSLEEKISIDYLVVTFTSVD